MNNNKYQVYYSYYTKNGISEHREREIIEAPSFENAYQKLFDKCTVKYSCFKIISIQEIEEYE